MFFFINYFKLLIYDICVNTIDTDLAALVSAVIVGSDSDSKDVSRTSFEEKNVETKLKVFDHND